LKLTVKTEPVATREVVLTIEPDPETINSAMRKTAREISRVRPVPGFRPGKAPYGMVERIFGRELILNEALNDIANDLYQEAVKEAGIEPLEAGKLEIDSQDPVVLHVNVPLMPEVMLGDYRALHIEPEPDVTIGEAQIAQEIEVVRRRHATYETVERAAQMGDQLAASSKGTSGGETLFDQNDVSIELREEVPPPGFAEALVGAIAGETREFSLTYPDDYQDKSLAGKNVQFTVTAKAVRQVNLPAIDDDLAKMAGDYETVADLREGLAKSLKEREESAARERETNAAVEALVSGSTVDYPAAALTHEVDSLLNRRRASVTQVGFAWDRYLTMVDRTEEEMREELRPAAEKSLVRRLVLEKYAQAENLNVEGAELAAAVNNIASAYGERAEQVQQQLMRSNAMLSIYGDLLLHKATDHLSAIATGRAEKAPADAGDKAEDSASVDSADEQPAEDKTEAQ
jgi:trigger factor